MPFCNLCVRLISEHERREVLYADAIYRLAGMLAAFNSGAYRRLRRAADAARISCEAARLTIALHKRVHSTEPELTPRSKVSPRQSPVPLARAAHA